MDTGAGALAHGPVGEWADPRSTVILAGPVFAEWYWGPVLFALVYGPFILAAAAVLTVVLVRRAKRRGKPLTRLRTLGLSLGLSAGISLLVLGGLGAT